MVVVVGSVVVVVVGSVVVVVGSVVVVVVVGSVVVVVGSVVVVVVVGSVVVVVVGSVVVVVVGRRGGRGAVVVVVASSWWWSVVGSVVVVVVVVGRRRGGGRGRSSSVGGGRSTPSWTSSSSSWWWSSSVRWSSTRRWSTSSWSTRRCWSTSGPTTSSWSSRTVVVVGSAGGRGRRRWRARPETRRAGEDEPIPVGALRARRHHVDTAPDLLAQERPLHRHDHVGEVAAAGSRQRRRRGQEVAAHAQRAQRRRGPALPDTLVVDAQARREPAGAVAEAVVVAVGIAVDAGHPPASLPRERAVDVQQRVAVGSRGSAARKQDARRVARGRPGSSAGPSPARRQATPVQGTGETHHVSTDREQHPGVNTASVRPRAVVPYPPPAGRGRLAALPGAAGVFLARPLGKSARPGPDATGPPPERSMAKPKTKATTDAPVTPALDDPLGRRRPTDAAAARRTGPYDQALAAGEELRRRPYAAAGDAPDPPPARQGPDDGLGAHRGAPGPGHAADRPLPELGPEPRRRLARHRRSSRSAAATSRSTATTSRSAPARWTRPTAASWPTSSTSPASAASR